MNSLRAHIKKPSAVTKGKKKPVLMNLNDDEEEGDEGDEEMVAREAKCMEQLERALSKCQKCGNEKCCKIDKAGHHHPLTFQQRRSWAVALVCYPACYVTVTNHRQASGTHGVTLSTPPKGDHFLMFHGPARSSVSSSPSTSSSDLPYMQPASNGFHPYMSWPPQFYQSAPPAAAPSPNPKTVLAPLSSDPPDPDEENPYPSISDFISRLDTRYPIRGLEAHRMNFEARDYYQLDELIRMSPSELTSHAFGLSSGNAAFLLEEARKEVKRVDKNLRKAKRARID
jgi:hypothetical protein